MRTSELFGAKTSDFMKFMVCPHTDSADILQFYRRGGGQFCADVFYGQPFT